MTTRMSDVYTHYTDYEPPEPPDRDRCTCGAFLPWEPVANCANCGAIDRRVFPPMVEVISADQPKKVVHRKIIEEANGLKLELVTFEINCGDAFGCRVFSDVESRITELYNDPRAAIRAARGFKVATTKS